MKTKALLSGGVGLLLLALVGLYLKNRSRPLDTPTPRGDMGAGLPSRFAALQKPALSALPQLTGVTSAPPPAAVAPVPPPCLSEETLEPLRRAFVPPRFTEDPAVPRNRQTLLSNRRLVSPEKRDIPKAASGKQSPSPRNTTPFIVQFNTPVSDASRKFLSDAGALVRGFFPNNALLAELTPETLAKLADAAHVQAASEFLPADKLQPFLSSLLATYPPETQLRATVQTFAPEDAEPVAAAVRAAGGTVDNVTSGTRWGTVQAVLPLSAVRPLAANGSVQWIEERPLLMKRNDKASIVPHLNVTNIWHTWGLTGKGQIVGHADTGLDTGVLSTLHPDFQGRIVALIARGRPGNASDPDGHGTHTAGSVLGSGAASAGQFRGMAWEAGLVHQSVMDANEDLSGIGDVYTLFQQSFGYGAYIHSDSWGSDTYGAYDSVCRSADLFAWDTPEHLAVIASGNAGRDANSDGVVDKGAVGSPATAKNVLAVGAAENDRPPGSGGYSSFTWGSGSWLPRYPVDPIKTDYISYSATLSPYRQGMAGFSSRGPTEDARIKPDVVAPGTDVISTRSSIGNITYSWGAYSANAKYCFMGGTSMATPLIAGTAALLRQYAVERGGVTNPSAALLKAMLVGGACPLAPGQYGTNATQEIPFASPNNVEGWGQPDIAATVHPSGRMIRLSDRISPAAGATNTFDITVAVSNTPLDFALSWIDYPATAGTSVTLVNDLDLLVIAPDGTLLYPNGGSTRDSVNTVETLRIAAAQPGVYRACVIGYSVPYSGGTAALYVRGSIDAPAIIVHSPLPSQKAGITPYPVTFQVQSLNALTNGEVRLFWTVGTAASPTGAWHAVTAAWGSNALFQTAIPVQPPSTHVYYYLEADTGTDPIRLPKNAPLATFSFYIDVSVDLIVEGLPARFGTVVPDYGTHSMIANAPFPVSAPATVAISNGFRRVCSGWSGTGDVPPSGSTNAATLSIAQPSTLTWQWVGEFALATRYRLADTGQLFGQTESWYAQNASATTETALDVGFVGSTPYAFCGWSVDGSRWPDAVSTSPNPATGIPMTGPRLAQGDYLPFWQDSDGNGLSDWWELRYFGNANSGASATNDPDGDLWSNFAEFLDNTDPRDPASQPTPPVIAVTPLATIQSERPPWTVRAVITDNFNVEQALLVWRERGAAEWQTTAMTWVGNDTYEAPLSPPSFGSKRVDYFVSACDLIGYYAPEFWVSSSTNSVIGDYEFPWLRVTPERFGLFELSESATNITLSVSNLAGPDLLWTARVAMATAPFAATNAAWTHTGANDPWCVTTNRTWNGDAVWYCGNPSTRRYPGNCHALLDTPPFLVGSGGGLLFRQWIKTEEDLAPYFWDGAVIRVSSDGGATFSLTEPVSGYPGLIVGNPASPFPADQPCLAGNGDGWETLVLDLSAYAGQNVIVRFEFGSDSYVQSEGWYIANVTPFSCDEPLPAWLVPQGTWGGTLPDAWSTPLSLSLDPTAIAFDDEVAACIRIESNDPSPVPLLPVTLRRGHRLFLTANGPGTATADRTFLFRGSQATVSLQANPGSYLYSVVLNGIPQQGVYTYNTVQKTMVFKDVTEDQYLEAWFSPRIWTLTIKTPYGVSTPEKGTHTLTNGTPVTASVSSPFYYNDNIRQECTGWSLTDHAPSSGTGPHMTFAITNDTTLSWNWKLAHRLTVLADANGSVSPTGGWYFAGSSVVITAFPALYYHFSNWYGDLSDAGLDGDRITVAVIAPRTVSAAFAPNLTAARGVPEYWLANHGWLTDFEAAAETDSDNDGMPAWAEWRADTNPTNPLSLLALTGISFTGTNGHNISWIGGIARTQYIESALTPSGAWIPLATNLPPTPVTNTLTLPVSGEAMFYRIHIP